MASLRADVDSILDVRALEPEAAHADHAEDTMFAILFTARTAPPSAPREHVKRNRSIRTSEGEDARARNKE